MILGMNIIVMGPQGSGKSTQADLLAKKLNLPHLQIGELGRRLIKQKTALGKKIEGFWVKGALAPDDLLMEILKLEINKEEFKGGFVLDGMPRTINQAKILSFKIDKVFYLKVSDKINVERLMKRGREDDTKDLIKKRLGFYHQETEPVLDYYRKMGILEEVDGERSIEMIFEDIAGRFGK